MFAVPLEQIALSNRDRAFCKRADLINSAQLLFAQPDDSPAVQTLFEATRFDLIREEAARVQAPESTSILNALTSANCDLEEGCFASGEDERDEGIINSPSRKALGKRKSLQCQKRRPTKLSDPFTLTSGDREIDALLGGGWRRGCLSEVVGESSSGKSQIGMQTVLYNALGLATFHEGNEGSCLACSGQSDDCNGEDDIGDELYRALQGCGIRHASTQGSVAILNSGGRGKGDMILRRLLQLSNMHIEPRWNHAKKEDTCQCKKSRRDAKETHKAAGIFQEDKESSANSLQEAQLIAKGILLGNLYLLSPKDYDSLEHAVTYTLPALSERLINQGKPRLNLVVIDDLPDMLIEEGENVNHSNYTLRRSRMVGEIADRLKRLAVFSPRLEELSSPSTAMALIVMNQVVDSFKANEDLLWPMLQQQPHGPFDEYASKRGPPPLMSSYQEGYYNGALASVDVATFMSSKRRLAEQMRGLVEGEEDDASLIETVSSSTKIAALGHSWVNCINVRIMLSKTKKVVAVTPSVSGGRATKTVVRRAVSVLNPFAEAGEGWKPHVEYIICQQGVRALEDVLTEQQRRGGDGAQISDEERLWSSLDVDLDAADLDGLLACKEMRSRAAEAESDGDSDSDSEWWKSIANSDIAECGSSSRF